VASETDWDGFDIGPNSDENDSDEKLPAELIKAETVAEMVEAAIVMGLNLKITVQMGAETAVVTVQSEQGDFH